ncbi:MAG: N-6 DNA methylase [Candidatus Methanomethylicaceae archaeon]
MKHANNLNIKINDELLPETIEYMKRVDSEYRKKLGQFFTPRSIREVLLSKLPKLVRPKVLDPSCGTGEFLISARGYFIEPELYGWEIDPKLVEIAKHIIPDAHIELVDALQKPLKEEFDVVLGNPPYFEFKPTKVLKNKFKEIIWGRPNIYAFFIYLGLKILKHGGYLAYVVSSSMNNGAYFKKLREFIRKNADIVYMKVLENPYIFEGVNHTFQLIVLKKGPNTGRYIFSINGVTIFSDKSDELNKLFKESTTLHELGYRVQTGKIVWNQNRNKLTNDSKNSIPLIWAHNIVKGKLVLNNKQNKPQYIRSKEYDKGPAIVVRRVVGHPRHSGSIEAALIPPNFKFLGENHVNVIYPPPNTSLEELNEIVKQINSSEAQAVVRMITGNTQISKTELERLFPIKIQGSFKKDSSKILRQGVLIP